MPGDEIDDTPSRLMCLAVGLFARMADCIEQSCPVEAIEAHRRLYSLGYDVRLRGLAYR